MQQRTWHIDGKDLVHPSGRRISLSAIEDWALAAWGDQQHIITNSWSGWRVCHEFLIPPGRSMRKGSISLRAMSEIAQDIWKERKQV
ncbi:hypothetical protein [Luteibacter sp.]|uniref:hypothetical protein n=1 Tax=Luteibacter sp. TaxID=1886636 RepID=UPI003F7DF514